MLTAFTYVELHVAGFVFWWWLIAPKSPRLTVAMVVLVSLAVFLFVRVVYPRYRRNSWSYEDRSPELIVHTIDRTWRQPERDYKPERAPEERNTLADIHGTG